MPKQRFTPNRKERNTTVKFTEKYHNLLAGAISGFDRVRFRGTLIRLRK